MSTSLQQTGLITHKVFNVHPQGLHIQSRNFYRKEEHVINYAALGPVAFYTSPRKKGWLIPALFFLLLALVVFVARLVGDDVEDMAELIYLTLFSMFMAIYYFSLDRTLYITHCGDPLGVKIKADGPNEAAVSDFVQAFNMQREQSLQQERLANGY